MTTHTQHRLDVEGHIFRLLGVMVALDGIPWTERALAEQTGIVETRVTAALHIAQAAGLVQHARREWYITQDGRTRYADEAKQPYYQTGQSDWEFRNEALTGMTSGGNQSHLTNAALPDPSAEHSTASNYTEDRVIAECSAVNKIRMIAACLGLSPEYTRRAIESGHVHICPGIDKTPHWGIFHRHNGANGKRWQSLCIACRQEERQKGRRK